MALALDVFYATMLMYQLLMDTLQGSRVVINYIYRFLYIRYLVVLILYIGFLLLDVPQANICIVIHSFYFHHIDEISMGVSRTLGKRLRKKTG